mmetsp:Transcript_2344/g.9207  ORF Transcript_2344/g.9207 Transcript_2344/m.9207 type:complete len:220 (-) Transcript_2344:28-687(-)
MCTTEPKLSLDTSAPTQAQRYRMDEVLPTPSEEPRRPFKNKVSRSRVTASGSASIASPRKRPCGISAAAANMQSPKLAPTSTNLNCRASDLRFDRAWPYLHNNSMSSAPHCKAHLARMLSLKKLRALRTLTITPQRRAAGTPAAGSAIVRPKEPWQCRKRPQAISDQRSSSEIRRSGALPRNPAKALGNVSVTVSAKNNRSKDSSRCPLASSSRKSATA